MPRKSSTSGSRSGKSTGAASKKSSSKSAAAKGGRAVTRDFPRCVKFSPDLPGKECTYWTGYDDAGEPNLLVLCEDRKNVETYTVKSNGEQGQLVGTYKSVRAAHQAHLANGVTWWRLVGQ